MKFYSITRKLFAVLFNKPKLVLASGLLLGIGLIVIIFIFIYLPNAKQDDTLQSKEEHVQKIIDQVGGLIELPKGERPTLATVSDVSKLSSQPFFTNAENGDAVLIYSLAKKAILFRPSKNKIIEVASVNLSLSAKNDSSVSSSSSLPKAESGSNIVEKKYKIELLNGTTTSGLASITQKKIETSLSDYIVTAKGDASKSDYNQTIVVDISGNNKTAAEKIAGLLNAKLESLPDGEVAQGGVDFLIILGSSN